MKKKKLILSISYTQLFTPLSSSFSTRLPNSALLIFRGKGLEKRIYSKCYRLEMCILPRVFSFEKKFPLKWITDHAVTVQENQTWGKRGSSGGFPGTLQNTPRGLTAYCTEEKAKPAKDKDGAKWHVDMTRASRSVSEVTEIAPGRNVTSKCWTPILPVTKHRHSTTFSICNANDKSGCNRSFQTIK